MFFHFWAVFSFNGLWSVIYFFARDCSYSWQNYGGKFTDLKLAVIEKFPHADVSGTFGEKGEYLNR